MGQFVVLAYRKLCLCHCQNSRQAMSIYPTGEDVDINTPDG